MKKLIISTFAFALLASTPIYASAPQSGELSKVSAGKTTLQMEARRGRGGDSASGSGRSEGRDRMRSRSDDSNGTSGSGRKKPRIKGGSGCDDPGDVAEHPECA